MTTPLTTAPAGVSAWRWLRKCGPVLVGVLVVALAAWAILSASANADNGRRAELLLSKMRGDLNAIDSLEWQAGGRAATDVRQQAAVAKLVLEMRADVKRLAGLLSEADRQALEVRVNTYGTAAQTQLVLLSRGRTEEAATFDEESTDPAFEAVAGLIERFGAQVKAATERLAMQAKVSTVGIVALSALLVGLLAGRARRERRIAAAFEHDAQTDHLTGLPNNRAFDARLRAEVEQANRAGGQLSLVLIDIDRFKKINDTHGHPAGDAVLVEVAQVLARVARSGEYVARIGGEEFGWILPATDDRAAWQAAERMRTAISDAAPGGFPVTVSAGVCSLANAASQTQLIEHADNALYRAKSRGRDMVARYSAHSGPGGTSRPSGPGNDAAPPPSPLSDLAGTSSALIDAIQEGVLVRDIDGTIVEVNARLCAMTGFERSELIGQGAPHPFWPPESSDAARASYENIWSARGEVDFEFRRKDGVRFPVLSSTSPIRNADGSIVGHVRTIRDLTSRKRAEGAERARILDVVRSLARAVDAKDPSTLRHSERVADLAARIASAMGWDAERVETLHAAGLVHDVGKIGVPDAILMKPGRLDGDEYAVVQRHSEIGAEIVAGVLTVEQVAWVRGHHERVDGKGYPDGLAGDDIPEGARIMALADAWDAMTSMRPYSEAFSDERALAECRSQSGLQFDPRAVQALERLLAEPEPARGVLDRALAG